MIDHVQDQEEGVVKEVGTGTGMTAAEGTTMIGTTGGMEDEITIIEMTTEWITIAGMTADIMTDTRNVEAENEKGVRLGGDGRHLCLLLEMR